MKINKFIPPLAVKARGQLNSSIEFYVSQPWKRARFNNKVDARVRWGDE